MMTNFKKFLYTTVLQLLLITSSHAAKPLQPGWPIPVHDDTIYTKLLVDRMEYIASDETEFAMEAKLWIGGDYNRLMLKTEGEFVPDAESDTSIDLVYSRMVFPYWDVQAGIATELQKHQTGDTQNRYLATVGFMGLAPYWFETDAALYLSEEGDVSGTLELEYDWLINQRTILQANIETMAAMQAVPEFGVYGGFNRFETGLRLRYEIKREFAPYIGINYTRKIGRAADAQLELNENPGTFTALAGLRFWM